MRQNRTQKALVIILALLALASGISFAVVRQSSISNSRHGFDGAEPLRSSDMRDTQNVDTPELPPASPSSPAQSQIETNKWKLCRNEKAGYELKYPGDWFVYGDGSENPVSPGVVTETKCSGFAVSISSERLTPENTSRSPSEFKPSTVWISVSDEERLRGTIYEGTKTIDEYLARLRPTTREKFMETTVGGQRAIWWDIHGFKEFKVYYNGRLFELEERNLPSQTFNGILSSLRFFP